MISPAAPGIWAHVTWRLTKQARMSDPKTACLRTVYFPGETQPDIFFPSLQREFCASPSLTCEIVHLGEPQRCQTLRGPSGTSTPWCSAARWQGWQPSAIHESVLWAAHWECAPPTSSSYTSLPTYITLFLPFLSSMPLCPPPAANPSTHLIPFLPSPALLSPDRPPCLGS